MNYLDTIDLKKSSTLASYSKLHGKKAELGPGSKKTRLQFSILSNNLTKDTADVYVEIIGDHFFDFVRAFCLSKMNRKFVQCTHRDNLMYINVKSLSERIGINKKDLYSAAKNKELLDLMIYKRHQEYIETEQKIDGYLQKIIEESYTEEGNKLKTRDGKYISKESFRNMAGIAALSKLRGEKNEIAYSLKNKNVLLLKKQEGNEWPTLILFTQKVLGKGNFGKIYVVQELSMGRTSVAKLANNKDSRKDVENESTILNIINDERSCTGIQQKINFIFNFRLNNKAYYGYVAPKYDCNLTAIIQKLSKNKRVECARQLLKGLYELEKQEICHGDINTNNCLFRKKANGAIECVIADFGGAKSMSERVQWPEYGTLLYRCDKDDKAYLCLSLSKLRNQYRLEKKHIKIDKISGSIKRLALKRDVYAMSFIIEDLLTSCSNEKSKEIKLLIKQMRNNSWKKRISAGEALVGFEKIFP